MTYSRQVTAEAIESVCVAGVVGLDWAGGHY